MPMRSKTTLDSGLTDHDLLIRIDERVAILQDDVSIYRRDLEGLKKRVYSLCGGLAVIQFAGPFLSRLASYFFGTHPSR